MKATVTRRRGGEWTGELSGDIEIGGGIALISGDSKIFQSGLITMVNKFCAESTVVESGGSLYTIRIHNQEAVLKEASDYSEKMESGKKAIAKILDDAGAKFPSPELKDGAVMLIYSGTATGAIGGDA